MEAEKIEGSAFMEYRETMAASSSDEDARMRRDAQETEMKSRNIVKPGRNRQDRNEKGVRRRRGRRNDSNRRKDFGRKRGRIRCGISARQKEEWRKLDSKMDTGNLVATMCRILREPKQHLIEAVVKDVGHALAVQVMSETKKVLAKGGMKRVDGKGYRKPGGVFLTILRKHISNDEYKKLMKDSRKKQQEHKRNLQQVENQIVQSVIVAEEDPARPAEQLAVGDAKMEEDANNSEIKPSLEDATSDLPPLAPKNSCI
mmetsp:Transcript_17790/g.31862  ORF Transcript_17790/g.31862 Transcript_17790/m.31862 type:complete len:258 (-) Transcript_17790:51-824(-)